MNYEERALSFRCDDAWLVGIISLPEQPSRRGVLIVVGGPQYRVGSHRQFALLARSLAAQGIPVLRFDYRGMGDSDGKARTFEDVGDDLRAAIDHFVAIAPGLAEVVIWGLCDAASAAVFYASQDARVCGLVLLNPWVRTSSGLAKATLKHYYSDRLLQPALWSKIVSGSFQYRAAAQSFFMLVHAAVTSPRRPDGTAQPHADLPERMHDGFSRFNGKVLLIFSGADLMAKEFLDMTRASAKWQQQLAAPRVTLQMLDEADHTFSRKAWRDQVAHWTSEWIGKW